MSREHFLCAFVHFFAAFAHLAMVYNWVIQFNERMGKNTAKTSRFESSFLEKYKITVSKKTISCEA